MKTFDFRGHSPQDISESDIPEDAERVILANNQIETLPINFFSRKKQITEIDLSRNKLISTEYVQVFRCLNVLDLRFNNLKVEDLYHLRFTTICHLKLYGNPFQSDPDYNPLIVPAIVSKAWIIDGTFVSDYIRKMASDLRTSKSFYEIVRPVKYNEKNLEKTVAEKKIFDSVSNIDFNLQPQRQFMQSAMTPLFATTDLPQTERLRYLYERNEISLPEGKFTDYFGLVLGLLCYQWLGEPIEIIPSFLCSDYWKNVSSYVNECENWEHLLIIMKIMNIIQFNQKFEQDLFESLQIKRYLASGKPPLPGSTPRLVLTSFIARSVSLGLAQISQLDDLKIYFKFRKNCGFTANETDLESIHKEFFAQFELPSGPIPFEGDKVSVAHPLTGEWVEGVAISVNGGRIFVQLGDIIIQMPVLSVFWDGRGLWKEGLINRAKITDDQRPTEISHNTFEVPPLKATKVAPSNRTAYLNIGREAMRTSKFIDRSIKANVTFRGIVDPPFHRPKTSRKKAVISQTQVVDGVVNIVKGSQISDGRYLRRFLVRFINELTKKTSYVWINEEDIQECDVEKLIDLYRKHIVNPMRT